MTELETKYICVVCGNRVDALYRQYSPTVLKVTNCERCGSISDKYIEYDPVIINVDMILLSKEAYRHVLYNTTFKAYWKLFIVLLLMETYLDWSNKNDYRNGNNFTCTVNRNDDHATQHSPLNFSYNSSVNGTNQSVSTSHEQTTHPQNDFVCQYNGTYLKKPLRSDDPFLTEKGIYLTFCFVFFDMLVFLVAVFLLSLFFGPTMRQNKVEFILLMKGLTLGGMGNFFMLPTIIWGNEHDTSIHAPLVLGYVILSSLTIHSVIYECSKMRSFFILSLSYSLKISLRTYLSTFTKFYL